ncbi:MAG: BMP family ABC transporter substrate-binding protein [Bacilli bacterium]|nr:BMP family ABC transporter substrate-binding protein [Bacilli bacterium]
MKKQLFLMSALALTALTSCGGQGGGLKVGLICLHDKNSTYDANFIEAFESACEEAKQAGKISEYSYVTDVPETDECYNAAERFVNQGYSIIFSDSYGHDPYMGKAAKAFPNVFFCSATGDKANAEDDGEVVNTPNYHNAFASIYEGRYLAGVAAGQYLKENGHSNTEEPVQLGYVGAFNYAEVISGYTSWFLGVKSIFKNATMRVTYTKSWYDYDAEAAAAQKLIDEKCVLISQHADSMGAPNTCKTANIPNVSYNVNTADVDPTCKDTYVAHSRINWKPYYTEVLNTAIGSKIKGEKGHDWTGTLKTGSVEYNVTDNIKDKKPIETAEKELKDGTRHVFDTKNFTCKTHELPEGATIDSSTGKLTSYKVNLNGDFESPKVIEQEIVKDGHVEESVYRSAPSFAIIIDGITEE